MGEVGTLDLPWIPLMRPPIVEADIDRVANVIRSGQLVQGPVVEELEAILADLLGVDHAVLVSSGTAALHLGLLALGVGPGDEVIVPAFSFVASANSVVLCGATPVFVDIRLEDFNVDTSAIEAAVTARTRAIMVVHEFGAPADMLSVRAIATKHNLLVLEDAACALGARLDGMPVGTSGTVGCFSFHPRKVTTTGEGGLVVTSDSTLAGEIRSMRSHGIDPSGDSRTYVRAGYNYRLSEMHAALMVGQVERLDGNLARRREIGQRYETEIKHPQIALPKTSAGAEPVWQTYHVLARTASSRRDLEAHLHSRRIASAAGAQCIPNEPYYRTSLGTSGADFPKASEAQACGLALPLFDTLEDDQVSRVIAAVNDFKERDDQR